MNIKAPTSDIPWFLLRYLNVLTVHLENIQNTSRLHQAISLNEMVKQSKDKEKPVHVNYTNTLQVKKELENMRKSLLGNASIAFSM